MKKFLLALSMAAALSGTTAYAAHNYTVADATAKQGETVELTIKLVHTGMDVAGYQGTLTAPSTGFIIEKISLKEENAPSGETDMQFLTYAKNEYTCNFLSYSPNLLSYTSRAAAGEEVATLTIKIADDVTPGTYTFNFSNMVFSTNDGGTTEKLASGAGSFKITVEAAAPANPVQDINDDGDIDILDILDMLDIYNEDEEDPRLYDFNNDGDIDILDILDLLDFYSENEELFD